MKSRQKEQKMDMKYESQLDMLRQYHNFQKMLEGAKLLQIRVVSGLGAVFIDTDARLNGSGPLLSITVQNRIILDDKTSIPGPLWHTGLAPTDIVNEAMEPHRNKTCTLHPLLVIDDLRGGLASYSLHYRGIGMVDDSTLLVFRLTTTPVIEHNFISYSFLPFSWDINSSASVVPPEHIDAYGLPNLSNITPVTPVVQ